VSGLGISVSGEGISFTAKRRSRTAELPHHPATGTRAVDGRDVVLIAIAVASAKREGDTVGRVLDPLDHLAARADDGDDVGPPVLAIVVPLLKRAVGGAGPPVRVITLTQNNTTTDGTNFAAECQTLGDHGVLPGPAGLLASNISDDRIHDDRKSRNAQHKSASFAGARLIAVSRCAIAHTRV